MTDPAPRQAEMHYALSRANNSHSKYWTTQDYTYEALKDLFGHHRTDSQKDGPAYVPGVLLDPARKSQSVQLISCLVFDVDGKQTWNEVLNIVKGTGFTAFVYSTYSHLTTESFILTDHFMKWMGKNKPDWIPHNSPHTQENLEAYVASLADPDKIPKPFTVSDRLKQTPKGMQITLTHAPIHKCRVLFPMKTPFVFEANGYTSTEQSQAWKSYYHGIGRALGLKYDVACADPPRLYYMPSCPPGSEPLSQLEQFETGEFLDYTKFEPVAMAEVGKARHTSGAASGTVSRTTPQAPDIANWLRTARGTFKLASILHERGHTIRARGDGGYACNCPFGENHTNGDEGGAFVVDPTEDAPFVFSCSHAGCQHKAANGKVDVAAFIARMLEIGWLTNDDLGLIEEAPTFDPVLEDARATALDCIQKIDGVRDIAKDKPGGGIWKHLDSKAREAFDFVCVQFAKRQGLKNGRKVIEREIARQFTPADYRKYVDRYGRIMIGGKHMIVDLESPRDDNGMMKEEDFIKANAADYYKIEVPTRDGGTTIKYVSRAEDFLKKHAEAARFIPGGFTFDPRRVGDTLDSETLNLYGGMKIEPNDEGSCDLLKQLLREVWCHGDEDLFMWCWEWLLHMVARPWERPDTMLAIRGEPGAGKSIAFDVCLKTILDDLMLVVDDENVVLGAFNSSIKGRICIVFEEAAFAGNAKLFAKLKARATGNTVHINEKFKPSYDLENFARMVIISNEDHFAYIKQGDRRYTVIETNDEAAARWKRERQYEKLIDQWKSGGAAKFVHEALNHTFRTVEGGI